MLLPSPKENGTVYLGGPPLVKVQYSAKIDFTLLVMFMMCCDDKTI